MQVSPIDARGVASLFSHFRANGDPQQGPLWSIIGVGDAYAGDMSEEAYLRLAGLACQASYLKPSQEDVIAGLWWVARRLLSEADLATLDTRLSFAWKLLAQQDSHARACGLRLKALTERRGHVDSLVDGIAFSTVMWLHSAEQFDLVPDVFDFIIKKTIERAREAQAA